MVQPILFYVESISFCHLARMIRAAEVLRSLDIPILFACGDNYRHLVEEKGFKAKPVPVVSPAVVYDRVREFKAMYAVDELEQYFKHDLRLVEELKPRLILYDMRLTIPLVGRILGIPVISVVNGIWTPYFKEPKSTPFHIHDRLHLPQTLLDRLYNNRIGRLIERIIQRPFSKSLDQLYENHGFQSLYDFGRYASAGDACFVADIPELVPLVNAPPNVVHVGPMVWDPPHSIRGRSIVLPKDRPTVYLSMGTSLFPDELAGPSVRGLLSDGYRVLLQTGGRLLQNLPANPNLHVSDFVANADVLPQSAVMISHGGVTTSYEALLAGTPILGIPSFSDQQWNTERLVALDAGAMLNPSEVTPKTLVATVERLVRDPHHRHSAIQLGARISEFCKSETISNTIGPIVLELAQAGASTAHPHRRSYNHEHSQL